LLLPFSKLHARHQESNNSIWLDLLDYARWCPSPHNVQPWKLKILSATEALLYYDSARIPGIVDVDTSFTIVGMSMFIECLNIAAGYHGYNLRAFHESEPRLDTRPGPYRKFASLQLRRDSNRSVFDRELIKQRRTSRLHYDGRVVPNEIVANYKALANSFGHRFEHTTDPNLIRKIVELNTDTILQRAGEKETMDEMRVWARTTEDEAARTGDGLWSKANAVPGKLMHNFMYHHSRFEHGWKLAMTRRMLNKGMSGTGEMAWITGPFQYREDWVNAGIMLQQLWLEMTQAGLYMHPLGTVITTAAAKKALLQLTGETEQSGTVWFLIRMGYSDEPPRSFRLPLKSLIIS
jgi:hypothetical protein